MQPANGFASRLVSQPTMAQTKKRKTPGSMREVLAQNLNHLMEQRYKANSNRPMALAKDASVSLSTVQRTLSREAGASIDTVEAFAKVFGLSAYQMIMPGWLVGEISLGEKRRPLWRGRVRQNERLRVRKRTIARR